MRSRFLQVLLPLSWLLLTNAQVAVGSGLSCVRSSPADVDGQTRITFLREDPAGLRSLYLTLWSGDMRLQACEVNRSPLTTERYRTLCDRSGSQGQETTRSFNSSALLALDASCAPVSSSAPEFPRLSDRDGTEGDARRKRALVMPGTLWCGRGSEAARYDQLGMFEDTDRCCREHDHCSHIISSFTVKYGVFNSNFYTVSHCDCDQRFRQCLQEVNDTVSSMVGYSFFNILRVPCFELKYQKRCTQMYWWGMCKVAKPAPHAVFKNPLPFNTSDVTSKYNSRRGDEKQHVTESPVISPHKKLPKTEHRCGPRDPPRGDTFIRSRTRRKGCKRQHKVSTVAPSQMPPTPRTHTTTPSAVHLNPSESQALITTKKKPGKKKHMRKGLLAYPTEKSHVPLQETIKSFSQTSSTTQSTPLFTQRPTAITTQTAKRHKKAKQSGCCGSRMPVRGFGPRCKSCLEQTTTTSRMTTLTTATTTNGLLVSMTIPQAPRLRNTTETPRQDTSKRHWSTATSSTPITTKPKTVTSLHKDGKPHKQRDAHLTGENKGQESMGGTKAQSIKERRIIKAKNALRNITDNQLLCESLKHLDECKYQIPPLGKKYHLQNRESKTSYHCDCTNRLAAKIKRFKQPSVLPTLLMDFVSPHCFKLPREKKCHNKKSCSGSFSKALDLLRTLKKIEEKDTAWVQNSGNDRKRGNPVRLYKRCLRLEREADMAQLR